MLKYQSALAAVLILAAGCGKDAPTQSKPRCTEANVICTIVGTGQAAFYGEGGAPEKAALYYPIDIIFDTQDRLLVLDWNNQRIRRVDFDGKIRTIMGNGDEGPIVDGGDALEATLHHTFSMSMDASGNLYLAGNHHPAVLLVDTNGKVHIVAGQSTSGIGEDGVPAREGLLDAPCGVAVAAAGSPLYVSDTNNNRIRIISADGRMTTICGDVSPGYSGDNGPALAARLHHPYRLRMDARSGDLYFCDTENHAVRRIDAAGTITTVAGTGVAGFSGDGGPATSAQLELPYDALIGPDGLLYIADTGNSRIRRVGSDGRITTVAGTGVGGFSGDGGDALAAQLDHPSAIAFDGQDNLWIADTYNHRIRIIVH